MRPKIAQALLGAASLLLATGCAASDTSAASRLSYPTIHDLAASSNVVVLARVREPVRSVPVPDREAITPDGPPVPADVGYERSRVEIISIIGRQPGAAPAGVTPGSSSIVGITTADPNTNKRVSKSDVELPAPGSTLPAVGMVTVLFLTAPIDIVGGGEGRFVLAALNAAEASLLSPGSTPTIRGMTGKLQGTKAPSDWISTVTGNVGSYLPPIPISN